MLLHLAILLGILKTSCAVEGVIWSKSDKDFIPLFSIPGFRSAKNDYLKRIRELEYHNFHKESITFGYYQEVNIVSFYDNNTKVSGICGEIWTILGDYLNFTLLPIRLEDRNFGIEMDNGSYNGILGLIERNVSQIIPRTGVFLSRLSLLDYTMPLWTVRYHLYLRPEWKHDEKWMYHLFSVKIWYSFFTLLLISGIAEYICEKYSVHTSTEKSAFNLQDHIFYTIAIASSQGCVPTGLHNKSRIVYICTSMFSWLILIAFSSHAIFLMMNKKVTLPFADLKSLIEDSKYDIIAFKGSMVHQLFQSEVANYFQYTNDFNRIFYATEVNELYNTLCFSEKRKIAAFEAEDRYKAIGKHFCRLVATKVSYFETWISSAVRRGFRYKRTFDNGILKMSETGLIDGLKDRWLTWKFEESQDIPFKSIDISQVYLIFVILFFGFVASVFILMIEYIIFFKSKIFKCKNKSIKIQIRLKNILFKN